MVRLKEVLEEEGGEGGRVPRRKTNLRIEFTYND